MIIKFKDLSLQQQLVLTYILILLIPVLIFTYSFFKEMYENSIDRIVKDNEHLLELEKNNIVHQIETMRRTAEMAASNQKFIDFTKRNEEPSIEELMNYNLETVPELVKIQFSNPSIEHIRFYINNHNLAEFWPVVFFEERIKETEWYESVIDSNEVENWHFGQRESGEIVNLFTDKSQEPKISLFRKITYDNGEYLGVLEIAMLFEHFFSKMYSNIQDGHSELLVLDKKMNTFTNAQNTFLGNQQLEMNDIIKQFKANRTDKQSSFHFTNQETPYLVVYTYLEQLDSYLVNVISLEEVYKDIKQTRSIVILVGGLIISVLSIITFFIISFILKRLKQLVYSMKKVEEGDLDIQIEVKGTREVEELAYQFQRMMVKINGLIADGVNKKTATKVAELHALKTQIDSHFLYNTLENIKMMAEIDEKYEISDAITSLGGMMRYNLKWSNEYVPLRDEITHISHFVALLNLRYEDKINLTIDIPPDLLRKEILKMMLQPLIENASKYGLSPDQLVNQGEIKITGIELDQQMMVEIIDNGMGISQERLKIVREMIQLDHDEFLEMNETASDYNGHGVGLRNVYQRLHLHYGDQSDLTIESKVGEYTKVTLTIPY